jgi:hypothetical protein
MVLSVKISRKAALKRKRGKPDDRYGRSTQ